MAEKDLATIVNLPAGTMRSWLGEGRITAEELTRSCLERIETREDAVRAWQFLDRDHALTQARTRDRQRKAGRPMGPLFGLPVGVKDIFDTADMPTENGTHLHAGRRPPADSAVVAKLREAGAVILGKTVTTEMAAFTPGKTRNPADTGRTPGGSSSGSAAAVADCMVPLGIGSQTNGSVIRPASFCGVFGFKPTFGLISRRGCLTQAPTLDHVGVFARTLEDTALLAESLMGFDPGDWAMRPQAHPRLLEAARTLPPATPRLAFIGGPTWSEAEPATREAFAELADILGERMLSVELPDALFADTIEQHRRVWHGELSHHYAREYEAGPEGLSARLRGMVESGRALATPDYLLALDRRRKMIAAIRELMHEYDAIVTPAAPGEAPMGLEATGSPVFCSLWTLLGTPALSLPILKGPNGLPLGCQLVAASGDDARLLRTARWLEREVAKAAEEKA